MQIYKLKIGIIKDYKELCSILEIEPKTGNSKKKQLKLLESWCDYERIGNSYKINYIYEEQMQITDYRGRSSPYVEDLKNILLYNFHNNGFSRCYAIGEMFEITNQINQYYRKLRKDIKALANYTNIEIVEIENFYMDYSKLCKSRLETALKQLKNDLLIKYLPVVMICANELDYIDSIGNKYYKSATTEYRKAYREELDLITKIEKQIASEYGCETKQEIVSKGLYKVWMQDVYSTLYKDTGIKYYYDALEFYMDEEIITKIVTSDEFKKSRDNINKLLVDNTKNSYVKNNKKHRLPLVDITIDKNSEGIK